jgi:hypothetical protein
MAEQREKCAHAPCNCAAAEDSEFCSAYCAGHEDSTDILCDCGHPECVKEV